MAVDAVDHLDEYQTTVISVIPVISGKLLAVDENQNKDHSC